MSAARHTADRPSLASRPQCECAETAAGPPISRLTRRGERPTHEPLLEPLRTRTQPLLEPLRTCNTTQKHTRRANRQRKPRDSWTRTSNAADTPHQPPSQPPSHVAACHGRCGAGAGPDRPRPRERARVLSGGSRSRGLTGGRRPSRVPHAPSRCARRPRSPRQQQPSGAAWRKRRSCARSWGAGARRWARRARSAHAVRTCSPRRLAARACGGLGWRSSRASTEARRTRGRRE